MFFKAVHHIWKSVFSVLWYRGLKSLIPDDTSLLWSSCRQAGWGISHWEKKSRYLIGYCPRKVYWMILFCGLWRISRNALTRVPENPNNCPNNPEIFWKIQKLSGQSRNCPDNPKIYRTIQKLSEQSKNCLDNLEIVRTIYKLSRQTRNCPDNPETVRSIQKLSRQFTNCPGNPQTVWTIHKLSI